MRKKIGLRFMWLLLMLLLLPSAWTYAQNPELKEVVLAPLPVDAREFAVSKSVVSGKIYVFGGVWGTTVRDKIFEYDVSSNTWNELPSKLPYPYYDYNAYAVEGSDGCLYFSPGLANRDTNDAGNYSRLLKFDPASQACQEVEGFDSPRRSVATERAKSGQLYFFGGWDGLSRIDVHEYDASSTKLTSVTELGFARASISTVLANDGNIYLFGGNEIRTVIEMFDTKKKQVALKRAVLPNESQWADRGPLAWNGEGKTIYLLMPTTGKLYVYDYDLDEVTDTKFKLSNPPKQGKVVYDNAKREVYLLVAGPYSDYTTRLIKLSSAELAAAGVAAPRSTLVPSYGSIGKGTIYAGPSLGLSFLGTTPQFGGSFEYGINENIGLGVLIRYWFYSQSQGSTSSGSVGFHYTNLLIAGQANYHLNVDVEKLAPFVGVIIGYDTQRKWKNPTGSSPAESVGGFVATAIAGMRYFLRDNMAFVARLGYGTFSYGALEVGVDLRL